MRPKILISILFFGLLCPGLMQAAENPNIIHFNTQTDATAYYADGYSVVHVSSDEIRDAEGNLLPDGTIFDVSLFELSNIYNSTGANFADYFQVPGYQEGMSIQLIVKDGKYYKLSDPLLSEALRTLK